MRAVIDASAAVALFVDQPLTAAAGAAAARYELAAPVLIRAEIGAAFWKYHRAGLMARAAIAAAEKQLGQGMIDCHELSAAAAAKALALAMDLDQPIYDCFYLALSRDLQAPLLTADRKLARAAEKIGVERLPLDAAGAHGARS